jgi:hypothetical protein
VGPPPTLVLRVVAGVMSEERMMVPIPFSVSCHISPAGISAAALLTRDIWYLMESFEFRIRRMASLAERFSLPGSEVAAKQSLPSAG